MVLATRGVMAGGSYRDEHKRTKLKGAHAEPETLYEGSPSLSLSSCRASRVACSVRFAVIAVWLTVLG